MTDKKSAAEDLQPDTAQADETTPAPAKRKAFETVDLMEPITRGEKTIDQLTLRKPKAGELRGLTLSDLIGLDIGTIIKVIPRISEPVLTDAEANDLDPADLTEIGGAIRGFFMTKAERAMMDRMLAEQQPKT